MANPLIIWAIVLLGISLLLFVIEIFVPSGGLIGIMASLSALAGVVLLFKVDTTYGLIGATVSLVGIAAAVGYGIRIAPHTPVIRLLTLQSVQRPLTDAAGAAPVQGDAPASLVGVKGKAVTDLRPVGKCLINGKRMDCLAEGGVIRAGTDVRVVTADGLQIKVRVDEE